MLRRNMALWNLLDEFEKGQVTLVSWTVPEGLTTSAIAELWEMSGFRHSRGISESLRIRAFVEAVWTYRHNCGGLPFSKYVQIRQKAQQLRRLLK